MRRRRIRIGFAAALAAGAMVLAPLIPATAAPVVVSAVDFEDGTTGSWTQSGGGAGLLSYVADPDDPANQVLSVNGRDTDFAGIESPTGLFTEGTTYTFSARVRLAADAPADSTSARFVVKAGFHWVDGSNATITKGGWTTITGTRVADADDSSVYIGTADLSPAAPYTYLIDDIMISTESEEPSGPQVVLQSDFETTTAPWSGRGATIAQTDAAAHSGTHSLAITERANSWSGASIDVSALFQEGVEYTVSAWVRLADASATPVGVNLGVNQPGAANEYPWVSSRTTVGADWVQLTGTVTSDPATPATILYVEAAAANVDLLLDDVLITAAEDPGTDPDIVPGGAVNPTTTPVARAQGTGDVSALTFDDGPNPGTTPALLDYLAANQIKAVFCVIGQNITAPGGAEILRRIVAEGHVLCNHSTGYADMGGYTADQARADMIQNLAIIRTALGDPNAEVPFWRAPNGSWGATPAVAVSLGMQPLAVVNTINDWATQDVPTLTANLRAAMKPGEIVLAHDGGGDRSGTLAAVQTVVDERLAAGWRFTFPIGTPSAAGETVISTDFEDGLGGWGPRADGTGTPTVALSSDQAHGGAQSALVSGRTSQGSGIAHDVTGILVPGETYELTAWLRFAAGQPTDNVWLSIARTVAGATTYSTLAQFSGMSNSEWVEVTARFQMGEADSALLYFETNYNGTNTSPFYIDDIVVRTPEPAVIQDITPIKDTLDFPVGVAIDSRETQGSAADLLLRHFDQVTPENHMKPEAWYNSAGEFQPAADAIALMDFAQENDLGVYGHVLVWHGQTPAWFFQNAGGEPLGTSEADKQALRDRMRTHIFDVAGYLAGQWGLFGSDTNPLYAFDVVNEVVSDSGDFEDGLRRSEWYRILGEEFIDLAFQYADEAFNEQYAAPGADRPVTLFINDYNTEQDGKQNRYHDLVTRLLDRGVPLDGVGHQFHVNLSMPVSALAGAIERFQGLGLTQAITELDVTTGTPVTDAKLVEQGYYYRDAFRVFREHAADIFSVTVWGLTDGRSWRADSGAPLVFDDGYQAKPAYEGVIDGDLPARLRTANVFQGDLALNAAAFEALEWRQLPLHDVEGVAAFQLRWAPDHLTAFVRVTDASPQSGDAIAFSIGETSYSVARDGTGDVPATAREVDGGYEIVAHVPLQGAASGATVSFDVAVTDGPTTAGWNSPDVLGTLTLIEPVSYLEVAETTSAPTIDGVVDDTWSDAQLVSTDKQVQGAGTASAQVRTLWQGDTLYVLMEVADPVIDVTGSDPWTQDSVEVYVDPGNAKNGSYRYDDMQLRISAENVVSFGTGDETFQRNRVQSATSTVSGGYIVEAAIDLLEYGGEGTFHGLDFQVNDAADGARLGIRNWADPTGTGYQSTARWGVGQLVGPADQRAESTVTGAPDSLVAKSSKKLKYTVTVTAAERPTGDVTVYDGSTPIATATLDQKDRGTVTVSLPRLAAGTHQLWVEYHGSDLVQGSISDQVSVLIR